MLTPSQSSLSSSGEDSTLSWHRGKLLFLAGFFFGGGGLSGAAVLHWNQDAAQPPDEDRLKVGSYETEVASCAGRLQRRVGSWWPHWEHAEAEVRHSVLLVRRVDKGAEPTSAVNFAEGVRCQGVPLAGAKVVEKVGNGIAVEDCQAASSPRLQSHMPTAHEHTIALTSAVGDVEMLRLPTAETHQQWVHALRAEAQGKRASDYCRLIDVKYPSSWQRPYERTRVVPLDRRSDEYRRVEQLALEQQLKSKHTYVRGKLKITSVARVQAPHVWEQYAMRRAIIASENDGDPEERLLWHGTCVPHIITKEGFDPRVSNLQGMFGGGVYFADRSTKSLRYAGASKPGDTGTLLLCRVSLGRPMLKRLPQSNMRRPPDPFPLFGWEHLDMWLHGKKFHSVFAEAGAAPAYLLMNEYIVYHTNQGFPEYVLKFELV